MDPMGNAYILSSHLIDLGICFWKSFLQRHLHIQETPPKMSEKKGRRGSPFVSASVKALSKTSFSSRDQDTYNLNNLSKNHLIKFNMFEASEKWNRFPRWRFACAEGGASHIIPDPVTIHGRVKLLARQSSTGWCSSHITDLYVNILACIYRFSNQSCRSTWTLLSVFSGFFFLCTTWLYYI